ncbi:MAG TPA: tripartite tricarboxylate transporter substrate binding protein [Burkholderiales bacterium]|nr:tripartite tricarboxylate transporter substrate binding protein [Burkholderiales bacterium]
MRAKARRTTSVAASCIIAGVIIAGTWTAASAQNYPARPIRWIVPFPPGGSTDIYSRVLGPKLSEALNQQVVIDNRPGAGGALGAELAAKAPADGYTIWMGQTNNLAIGPALRAKNAYDPVRDYAPITLLMKAPQVYVVVAGSPIGSIKDLIAAAKKNPGGLTYGSAGVGSSGHISGALFNMSAGVDITHVPYKGASPAIVDLRAGRITLLNTSLASAAQMTREGKIKPIATTGLTRARMMPDVPTVAESGLPGFETTSWHGMLAPAKVSPQIVTRLNAEFVKILAQQPVQDKLLSEGGDITPSTPAEFATFLKSEVTKWAKVIKEAKITVEGS